MIQKFINNRVRRFLRTTILKSQYISLIIKGQFAYSLQWRTLGTRTIIDVISILHIVTFKYLLLKIIKIIKNKNFD